jgi:hypothetical protein
MERHVCLSHGVQVTGVTWWAATRIMVGVGDMVLRAGDSKHRSDGIVCGLHHAQVDVERGFKY